MLRCACVCKVGLYPEHGADFGQIRIFYTMWMLFVDIITDIGLWLFFASIVISLRAVCSHVQWSYLVTVSKLWCGLGADWTDVRQHGLVFWESR